MARNLMVCSNSSKPLKMLTESAGQTKRYLLEGIFAELDVKNRNQRIYTKEEYLKHLDYLREDIRTGQSLLGELDHPEDRFEVKLKEASHRILDIWYDRQSNCVMGKIELLNTPNGLLAQSLLEQGIPLHISSRAAGTVNSDNTVNIQQIYTYDLVCKPGFAKAVLHTVNESASYNKYTEDATEYLRMCEEMDFRNLASQFGMSSDYVLISEMATNANLRQEAIAIQEETTDNDMNIDSTTESKQSFCSKCFGSGINPDGTPCKCKNVNEEDDEQETEDDSQEDEKSEEKDDNGVEILSVRAVTSSDDEDDEDGVEIKDVKSVDDDSESDDDDEESEDDESEETEEDTNEEDEANEDEDASEKNKCDSKEKDMLLDCDVEKDKKEHKETLDRIDDLIATIKSKKESKKQDESMVVAKYPLSAFLSESMFAEFMSMNESQKSNVMTYINEANVNPAQMTQKLWETATNFVPETEIWLKYAPANYKSLYESADEYTKNSIRNTAQYILFESQSDINNFWRNTGLQERTERNLLNEQFVNNMPKVEPVNESQGLGYSMDFVKQITEMACAYNN